MGNGRGDIYGVLISAGQFPKGEWTHVAFNVDTPHGWWNPHVVDILVNGFVIASGGWTTGGARQVRPDMPIVLGGYKNQDRPGAPENYEHPDPNKWWRGYMDEVRFWLWNRTPQQIRDTMHSSILAPCKVGNLDELLAYYKNNEATGLIAHDSWKYGHDMHFTHPDSNSPQWKFSGVKVDVCVDAGNVECIDIELPGAAPGAPPTRSFTYNIRSVPDIGTLWANGRPITVVPFTLMDNMVRFCAAKEERTITSFEYFGGPPSQHNGDEVEEVAAIVRICTDPLPIVYDACGVPDGDGSSCQCLPLPFFDYTLNDIERILLLWEIEQTLDVVVNMQDQIAEVQKLVPAAYATDLQTVIDATQEFVTACLADFNVKQTAYLGELSQIVLASV
jgi:hypothetical protein